MSQSTYYTSTPPASSSRYSTPPTHLSHPSTSTSTSTSTSSSHLPPQLSKRDSHRLSSIPGSIQHQLFGQQHAPQGILDRPLNRSRGAEVSMAAWAFLFAEVVSYCQSRVDKIFDLEQRLSSLGYEAGTRILSLLLLRNTQASNMKDPRREHRLIPILQFVHTQVYRYLFGRPADGLEKSVEAEDEYMITLNQPPLSQDISIPKDMTDLSVEAFTAGIVEGVLDGLDLPARVTAHTVGTDQYPHRSVILVKLDPKVMDREAVLGK